MSAVTSPGLRKHFRTRSVVMLVALVLAAAASLVTTQSATSAAPQLGGPPEHSTRRLSAWQPQGQTAHLAPTLDPHATGITNTAETYNWSGYVDTGPTFTAVSAQWAVPTVQPSQSAQYSSTWIGIDGYVNGDTSLIQTGTAQADIGRRRRATTTGTRSFPPMPSRSAPSRRVTTWWHPSRRSPRERGR